MNDRRFLIENFPELQWHWPLASVGFNDVTDLKKGSVESV
jgi:hypothetical protein